MVLFSSPASANDHAISAATIQVVQNDSDNTTNSVTISATLSINDFRVRDGSSRGDYFVQIGDGFSDDSDSGVLMSCVTENGRDNQETNYPGTNFCTSTIDYTRTGANAGGYYVSTFNAPTGDEYNINVAAAFFPYSDFLGGFARNSGATNGGANDLFTGSPGIALGTQFVDLGGGQSTVDLTSFGVDSRTDGILLVTHGKNEDNYALSEVNSNNGTWTVYVKDNGTDAGSYEQDPVAFVYIPRTNTTVISGRFRGDGIPLIYSGASPQFSIANIATGTWRLTIPGYTPANGVLILSAEGGLSQNQDNIVSYQPDGDGWVIESRDLPNNPPGLQTPGGGTEPVASFVFIPATPAVTLVSPATQSQTSSPVLEAAISNAPPGRLTVQFYGRQSPSNPSGDFTLIAMPDTQFYTDSAHGGQPAMFYSQTEWIITNRVPLNIVYVAQLGDLVDHGDSNGGNPPAEWKVATNAMYRMESPLRTSLLDGIPYGVAVGNHDESPNGSATGTTTSYNQYFGVPHFSGRAYYAGHYGTTNNNHFDYFSAGGMDFIVLYFQYDPNANPDVLAWGDAVLTANNNRRAIIITHNFGNTSTPLNFSAQGLAIYNMAKTHTNVFMMLAGHVTGQGQRTDTYRGHTIRTFVSDYQGWTNGGDGFLRIITFSPANNQVIFQTFSPWTGEWKTDSSSEFYFTYNMQPPNPTNQEPFVLLGSVSNVVSGMNAALPWNGLTYDAAYEWYVTLTDTHGNSITGPLWRFSTVPDSPPTTANQLVTVIGDSPANLTLPASDANNDPLTFYTNSLPTHGINVDFDPLAGTLTYLPVRGFRGFDKFTYSATDGIYTSAVVTLNLNVTAPADLNANGIPDAWELEYGVSNATADADQDGGSNLQEYLAGTNPTNAASALRITSTARDAGSGHVTIAWQGVGGTRYRVQYSDGDASGGFNDSFHDVTRSLATEMAPPPYGAVSTQTFVDDFSLTGEPPNGARYYRVQVAQ